MNKAKLLEGFQKLGKVLMAPVLILPISGILVGIGSAFSNPNLIKLVPFLGSTFFVYLFQIIKAAGNVVNDHIPVIFAMAIAYGFAKSEKGTAALSGFLGYMTMNTVMGTFLTLGGTITPEELLTGQKSILGILTLDTGVFGGILIGLLVSYLHNKYYKIELPPVLSLFNGTRSIPAITIIASCFAGLAMSFIFPPIQSGLNLSSEFIVATGSFGAFLYGLLERLLLPFGLHHFIYLPFFFTSLGGVADIGGEVVEGAVNIYNAILNTPGAKFDISVSRFLMNGKVIFAMCGLPGAAFAIYKTALPQNRKKIASLMIAVVIPCALMGISEPLEYSFLFVAPALFGIHAIFSGLAYFITYIVQFNVVGSAAFGGPFMSLIFNGILGADKGSNWLWVFPLGVTYFLVYYFVFKFAIEKWNLKTPGREIELMVEDETVSSSENDFLSQLVEAVGGKDNIIKVDACFTRLRLTLENPDKVSEKSVFTTTLSANGVVNVTSGIQIIYGNKAAVYKTELREYLGME
ncbi:PTS glucose transporter subunit IIB [Vagococcus penaei]|uniref:PTS glucose transporter subunit IIB n=1 Tax=Vagococcus penaei TaxID=633807 RepID=A0A1Q2D7F8_9ENTE|nr:PTS transporter subunit EIIC [Vagococcus penaei]AQP54235.1 PTS glucose transporter subunit IIB [Vagococcus penaei]RST98240.1 PTS glucose transporter subunit IIB [Vagococcus penaei]